MKTNSFKQLQNLINVFGAKEKVAVAMGARKELMQYFPKRYGIKLT